MTLDGQNGNGSSWSDLDLRGFDQTLAGLANVARMSRLQRVYNGGATPVTLTINSTGNHVFGGVLGKTNGNQLSLAACRT